MQCQTAILPDFWRDAINTCGFAKSYGSNHFFEGRFIKLLFGWMLRNVIDSSVLHIAVSTEEALEVLRPASKDGGIVSE